MAVVVPVVSKTVTRLVHVWVVVTSQAMEIRVSRSATAAAAAHLRTSVMSEKAVSMTVLPALATKVVLHLAVILLRASLHSPSLPAVAKFLFLAMRRSVSTRLIAKRI